MLYKSRTTPRELEVYQYLNTRIKLSEIERKHLYTLRKGFEGEVQFDRLTSSIQSECLILNDLLLQQNRSTFQIDTLIIAPYTIHLFEVKNFEGDYFYDYDRLYTKIPPQSEVTNPLIQLTRSESLLRQLLQSLGCNLPIQSLIVFINPEFTLYQTPINKPFLFHSQINRFLENINTTSGKLINHHKELAEQITAQHLIDAPFFLPPSYEYDELRKGNTCENCGLFKISVAGTKCICKECGKMELSDTLIMRNVKELTKLFPDKKIDTNTIYEWLEGAIPKRTIGRSLKKHMNCNGVRQWSHYEF
ncbi:NERD domain-containing protein [Sutcliffiella horikoshii]|uniref:NERD domain-containing protein n=1 Tax=Sutcliffiella horikoshii TaxID=79883 RepID=A0A5D4T4F8_9BACI|nr:nuclease-related domain-containing protein [Sutcliffiella horikoshii]TYS69791.1 NERD domain-containing protein [Sutcliffiella horikoshii]